MGTQHYGGKIHHYQWTYICKCGRRTNRRGRAYSVYHLSAYLPGSCAKTSKVFIAIKGEKVITSITSSGKTKSLTINYGNGACDNTYTVTSVHGETLTAINE